MKTSRSTRERGFTMIVALVFLLLISLLAISGMRSSTTNLLIAGNMQARAEATQAAQVLIEQTISTTEFTTNPSGVANAAKVTTDFNGDGAVDSVATLANASGTVTPPACIRARAIPVSELDITNANDQGCFQSSSAMNNGIVGGASGGSTSLCANTEWDVSARGVDTRSSTSVVLHQGVSLRTDSIDLANKCK